MTIRFKRWECNVQKAYYAGKPKRVALRLADARTGEPIATATINLPDVDLAPNEVIIKDYSENKGMLDALINAGVVTPTGRSVELGFGNTAPICALV